MNIHSNRILRTPDTDTAGAPPQFRVDLAAENALLKEQLEQRDETEALIAAKVAVGLSREQAIASIQHQQDFDARVAELDKKAAENRRRR